MRRLALALCLAFSLAHAQEPYPSRGIRLVIDTSPGGVTDLFGRLIAEGLSQKFSQGVFVDNKPGASGNLAIDFLVRAPADGYTLMIASGGGLVVKPFLERGLTFDVMTDLVPVFNVAQTAHILVVPASVPAKDVGEFIAYAKAQPGQLHYGSAGIGSPRARCADAIRRRDAQIPQPVSQLRRHIYDRTGSTRCDCRRQLEFLHRCRFERRSDNSVASAVVNLCHTRVHRLTRGERAPRVADTGPADAALRLRSGRP